MAKEVIMRGLDKIITGSGTEVDLDNISSLSSISHTNGTVTTVGSDTVITFTVDGILTVQGSVNIRYLVVGGGGAGGFDVGGGGGAGGYLAGDNYTISSGIHAITIGNGGVALSVNTTQDGLSGGNSSIGSLLIAYGGGGGGHWSSANGYHNGLDGGSGGGGGGWQQTSSGGDPHGSQGNAGGDNLGGANWYSGGGGGGAGGAGGNSNISAIASAGIGLPNDITGTSVTYATGGRGGEENTGGMVSGTANTGNGGDGAGNNQNPGAGTHAGWHGGSGIVIVRFPSIYFAS